MKSITQPRHCPPFKVIIAGVFLLSCAWSAWRVAGSIVVVQGDSMLPSFHPNDYAFAVPPPRGLQRGDVVILDDGHQDYAIKRIVGLPGETVYLSRGQVFINRRPLHEPYLDRNTRTYPSQRLALFILGKDQYFVMGDNRANSVDSRMYGPVGIERIRKMVPMATPKAD